MKKTRDKGTDNKIEVANSFIFSISRNSAYDIKMLKTEVNGSATKNPERPGFAPASQEVNAIRRAEIKILMIKVIRKEKPRPFLTAVSKVYLIYYFVALLPMISVPPSGSGTLISGAKNVTT